MIASCQIELITRVISDAPCAFRQGPQMERCPRKRKNSLLVPRRVAVGAYSKLSKCQDSTNYGRWVTSEAVTVCGRRRTNTLSLRPSFIDRTNQQLLRASRAARRKIAAVQRGEMGKGCVFEQTRRILSPAFAQNTLGISGLPRVSCLQQIRIRHTLGIGRREVMSARAYLG